MTEVEVSMSDEDYRRTFLEQSITVEKDSKKECNKRFLLRTSEERASLLKDGFTDRDIESEYIKRNGIIVIGINW